MKLTKTLKGLSLTLGLYVASAYALALEPQAGFHAGDSARVSASPIAVPCVVAETSAVVKNLAPLPKRKFKPKPLARPASAPNADAAASSPVVVKSATVAPKLLIKAKPKRRPIAPLVTCKKAVPPSPLEAELLQGPPQDFSDDDNDENRANPPSSLDESGSFAEGALSYAPRPPQSEPPVVPPRPPARRPKPLPQPPVYFIPEPPPFMLMGLGVLILFALRKLARRRVSGSEPELPDTQR